MISGNRMPKANSNKSSQQKPTVIHKISDYNQNTEQSGNAYQVIKPKKQNLMKVDASLQNKPSIQNERKPLHQNNQNNINNDKKQEDKPKFMSVARHGVKIGGQVIGNLKWQCKICKLVNLNTTISCLRCSSEKGEIKSNNLLQNNVITNNNNKPKLIPKKKPL